MLPITAERRAYIALHIAIFLYGFSAILAKLMQLSSIMVVWWRLFLTSLVFLLVTNGWKTARKLPRFVLQRFAGIGGLIMVCWICFFASIKYSNASVALVAFSLTALFSAILEPILERKPIKKHEIALGIVILPAVSIVAGGLPSNMGIGFTLGLISAILCTLFFIANKKNIHFTDSITMTFSVFGFAWIFMTLLISILYILKNPAVDMLLPSGYDWLYLSVMVLLCTNLAYVLTFRAMQHLSAFITNLAFNLEPVYGMLMAIPILHENKELPLSFYLGGLMILLIVMSYPFIKAKFEK